MLKYPHADVNLKCSFFLSTSLTLSEIWISAVCRKATSKSSRSRIRATLMIYLYKNLHLKAKFKLLLIWLLFAHPQLLSLTTRVLDLSCLHVFPRGTWSFLFPGFSNGFCCSFQNRKGNTHCWCVFIYLSSKCVSMLNISMILCAVDVKKTNNNICRVSQRLWEILFKGFRPSVGPMVIKSRINS